MGRWKESFLVGMQITTAIKEKQDVPQGSTAYNSKDMKSTEGPAIG